MVGALYGTRSAHCLSAMYCTRSLLFSYCHFSISCVHCVCILFHFHFPICFIFSLVARTTRLSFTFMLVHPCFIFISIFCSVFLMPFMDPFFGVLCSFHVRRSRANLGFPGLRSSRRLSGLLGLSRLNGLKRPAGLEPP